MYDYFRNNLIIKYPNLFSNGCPPIECGSGWFALIESLCDELEPLIDHVLLQSGVDQFEPSFHVSQIKEKYGGLRFYISYGTQHIYDIIDKHEVFSHLICEKCGSPGYCLRRNGWISTLCNKCVNIQEETNEK